MTRKSLNSAVAMRAQVTIFIDIKGAILHIMIKFTIWPTIACDKKMLLKIMSLVNLTVKILISEFFFFFSTEKIFDDLKLLSPQS